MGEDQRLVAALCPGLIDTDASRPWFADMSEAQTPAQAAAWPVDLALGRDLAFHGELASSGAWFRGPRACRSPTARPAEPENHPLR